jgi:acyl dehydratase
MREGVEYRQRFIEDVAPAEELPRVEDIVTYRRVIMNPATTWDYFPGHHDPEYARAQGQPTIYVNTMFVLGFLDRCVAEWSGPQSFLARRKVSTRRSVYAGDIIVGAGRVAGVRHEERDGFIRHLVDLELEVTNQHGEQCVAALASVALPSRADGGEPHLWW